jgi:hypothetical protein
MVTHRGCSSSLVDQFYNVLADTFSCPWLLTTTLLGAYGFYWLGEHIAERVFDVSATVA